MKKEILISVLIGLTLGLIITYGVYRFRSSSQDSSATTLEKVSTASPSPNIEASSIVSIHSPQDGAVLSETTLTVTGNTKPDTYVVLFVNDTEQISTSDGAGNFSFQVTVAAGPNILRVHVVDETGTTTVTERTVVVVDTEDTAATPSADTSETKTAE